MNIFFHSHIPEVIRRKKFFILLCGVVLYFLTCMAKVLIPGSIYNELIAAGLNAPEIAGTGAAFMYAYAASQLLAGVYSNRYGGVRILLIGGSLFAIGCIGFPAVKFYWLMLLFRILTGLGAGTVFLGLVKLIGDLYGERFAIALGTVMFFSYFGPAFGTTPMVMLTHAAGWRLAMMIPGLTALTAVIFIILTAAGTIKPVVRGESLEPLKNMLKNKSMLLVNLTVPTVFGAYYILTSQLGQKSLSDHCGIAPKISATVIMGLTLLVAANNVLGNILLKLCGNRRKTALIIAMTSSFAGALAGFFAFKYTNSAFAVTAAYVLIAIPAGFFPIFGAIAKELNPPSQTGLSVALLNFWCFVYIAAFQNISGRILQHFSVADSASYPPAAYCGVFVFLTAAGALSLLGSCFCKETAKMPPKADHL